MNEYLAVVDICTVVDVCLIEQVCQEHKVYSSLSIPADWIVR